MGNDFSSNSQIVCGSWSSEFDMKGLMDPSVKEKIEDAMRDLEPIESNIPRVCLTSCRLFYKEFFQMDKNLITRNRNMSSNSSGNTPDLLSLSGMDL